MSEIMKEVFKGVKNQIVFFALAALKSGASNIGKQLVDATSNQNSGENSNEQQVSSLQLESLANALKTGILATGQDLISVGLDRMRAGSPQEQSLEKSEEAAFTNPSEKGK
jgi:hypothetical protein